MQVKESNHGKIVNIDIETGSFDIADDILPVSEHILARVLNAQTWFLSIGHRSVDLFGSRNVRKD
jgi:hypothetical protein